MAAEDASRFFSEHQAPIPDRIRVVGNKIIRYWDDDKVVASTAEHTPLTKIESPNDPTYKIFYEEAGPDGIMHHPV